MGIKEMCKGNTGMLKALAAGGIFLLGYCSNTIFTGPEALQRRIERKVSANPAAYTLVMEHAFDFSYGRWVDGQKQNGVYAGNAEGIAPRVGLDSDSGAYLSIADLAGGNINVKGQTNEYCVRRLDSPLAKELGTQLALGTPEQSIDQFVGTLVENKGLLQDYPPGKMDVMKKYAALELKDAAGSICESAKGGLGQLYGRVKGWLRQ